MTRASNYRFVTRWDIPAPVERVWQELMTPEAWPVWWRGVEQVVLLRPGTGPGLGAIRRYIWKSRLPYRLSFTMETTRIEDHRLIEGVATGELEGRGCWSLSFDNGVTHVEYVWEVATTKLWMRLLSPIARPLFAWNHDVVMEWGRQGLLHRLDVHSERSQQTVLAATMLRSTSSPSSPDSAENVCHDRPHS